MEVKSVTKFARISDLKAREVARAVQGMPVSQALSVLNFTPKKAALLIGKTLRSAIANASARESSTRSKTWFALTSFFISSSIFGKSSGEIRCGSSTS